MAAGVSQEAVASLSPYYAKCGPRTSSIAWELVEMQNLRHHPDLPGQDLHLCACSSSRGAALDRSPPPATAGPTLPPPQRDFLRGALLLFTPLPPHRNIISSGMGSYLIFKLSSAQACAREAHAGCLLRGGSVVRKFAEWPLVNFILCRHRGQGNGTCCPRQRWAHRDRHLGTRVPHPPFPFCPRWQVDPKLSSALSTQLQRDLTQPQALQLWSCC